MIPPPLFLSLIILSFFWVSLQDVVVGPGVVHCLPSPWSRPGEFVLGRWRKASAGDSAVKGEARNAGEGARGDPFAYLPFLAGPHACIGRKFAHLEACTVLAVLLAEFSFSPVPGREVRAALRVTQRPTPTL